MPQNEDDELVNQICRIGIDALVELYGTRPEVEGFLRHLSRRISVLVFDALREEQLRQRLNSRCP